MLTLNIDEANGIAILEPNGPLSKSEFDSAAKMIDPYIEKSGSLKELIIRVDSFPGWDSFAALSSHLKFVKAHHKKIFRVALTTDSVIGKFAETIASHFVNAEIKVFPFNALDTAKKWIGGDAAGK